MRRRLAEPSPTALADAITRGDLIRTYAFRGTTHLLAAQDAGIYLAVRAANRQWERQSWRDHYGLEPDDWPNLREVVREVVAGQPIGHSELAEQVAREPRFGHLRAALSDPSHTLLKPLGWQGDLCFGPVVDGRPTFQSPAASPHWRGSPMALLEEHTAALAATEADSDTVTLLPGYDQWVLGPGTADQLIVPPAHRTAVTRGANVAVRAGRVAATWVLDGTTMRISWFTEADRPPHAAILAETERLAGILGLDLDLDVTTASP